MVDTNEIRKFFEDLYRERQMIREREIQVMVDILNAATKGKEVIISM